VLVLDTVADDVAGELVACWISFVGR
jgi:hypothetical protein